MFTEKSPLFYNHLGHFGSSWNQLSELYLPMISAVDLGVILGHFVFYKYPNSSYPLMLMPSDAKPVDINGNNHLR
jgi:hypothetical protein